MFKSVMDEWGTVDVLVNNAGVHCSCFIPMRSNYTVKYAFSLLIMLAGRVLRGVGGEDEDVVYRIKVQRSRGALQYIYPWRYTLRTLFCECRYHQGHSHDAHEARTVAGGDRCQPHWSVLLHAAGHKGDDEEKDRPSGQHCIGRG